ncbi:MAG: carbamoyl phosphate synthase large subunit, partial [Candidatus Adiutrix sp.]|nr:carbamoyl phosphate synthase large subunit [Candidatus Adiutrix sp.]
SFGQAFIKAQLAAGFNISKSGGLLLSVCDDDKREIIPLVRALAGLGYTFCATAGTCERLQKAGFDCEMVNKMGGARPNLIDRLNNGNINLVVNTISGQSSARDAQVIRAEAIKLDLPLITTVSALRALVEGLLEWQQSKPAALQDFH